MKPDLVNRLRRLLVLIPFAARRPGGVPVEEVLEFAGYGSEAELYEDIELANAIALPTESPDEWVCIELEGDRLRVILPQKFDKPPRLSLVEGAALLVAAEPLREQAGETLQRALERLRQAMPEGTAGSAEQLARCAALDTAAPKWHAELSAAIEQRREVVLEYWAASRGEAGTRRVEPRALFLHHGHWYLAADVVQKGEEHLYRLDRMAEVRVGERRFEPKPPPQGAEGDRLWRGPEASLEVEVRFAESVAPLVRDRYGAQVRDNPDGSVTLVTRVAGEAYAIGWVLGYGGEAEIVRPQGLRERLAARVGKLAKNYSAR